MPDDTKAQAKSVSSPTTTDTCGAANAKTTWAQEVERVKADKSQSQSQSQTTEDAAAKLKAAAGTGASVKISSEVHKQLK